MLFMAFVLAFVLSIIYYVAFPGIDTFTVTQKPTAEAAVAMFVNTHQTAKKLTYKYSYVCEDGTEVSKILECPQVCEDVCETKDTGEEVCARPTECPSGPTRAGKVVPEQTTYQMTWNGVGSPYREKGGDEDALDRYVLHLKAILSRYMPAYSEDKLQNIHSAIFCVGLSDGSATGEKTLTSCETGTPYVVTYANPDEMGWTDKMSQNGLWRAGIVKQAHRSYECGVLYPTKSTDYPAITSIPYRYDKNADYVLNNSKHMTVSVPKPITDIVANELGLDGADDSLMDIMLCITPISDIETTLQRKKYERRRDLHDDKE